MVFHSALIGNELDQRAGLANNIHVDWKPISTAPFACDLELAVVERDGPHTVAFPVVALSADGSQPKLISGLR